MHLRLPKMRAIVPPSVLRELDERFGVSEDDIIGNAGGRKKSDPGKHDSLQRRLFEKDDAQEACEEGSGNSDLGKPQMHGSSGTASEVTKAAESLPRTQMGTSGTASQSSRAESQSAGDKIIRALREAGESLGPPLLRLKTGIEKRQLEVVLREMVQGGLVFEVRVDGGTRYSHKSLK